MTHRSITLTEDERTAALLAYLFTCLAFVCAEPSPDDAQRDDGSLWFYGWVTNHVHCHRPNASDFGDAVMWAMRGEADPLPGDDSGANPAQWLSYVEHVVGYRCGPGNGHTARGDRP